ncbi:MAG: hypothetical protein IKJ58_04805 [Akkermansia sp.]|nr:hypothetical protein [Akkermansia sp.]
MDFDIDAAKSKYSELDIYELQDIIIMRGEELDNLRALNKLEDMEYACADYSEMIKSKIINKLIEFECEINSLKEAEPVGPTKDEIIATLEAEKAAVNERVAAIKAEKAATDERIATMEAEKAAADERIATMEAEKAAVDERIATMEAEKAAADERIATMEAEKAAADERIATMEAEKAAADERMLQLEQQLEEATAKLKSQPPVQSIAIIENDLKRKLTAETNKCNQLHNELEMLQRELMRLKGTSTQAIAPERAPQQFAPVQYQPIGGIFQ